MKPIGPVDPKEVAQIVDAISPKGKTPLTAAVRKAADELRYEENRATVILVSDGEETCGGDPCAVARELEAAGIDFTVHVVGFDLTDEETENLRCMAESTGGRLLKADNAHELELAMSVVKKEVTNEASSRDDRYYAEMSCGPSPNVRSGKLLKAYFLSFRDGVALTHTQISELDERLEWQIQQDGTVTVQGTTHRNGKFDGTFDFAGKLDADRAQIPGSLGNRKCNLSLWRFGEPTSPMTWLTRLDGNTINEVLGGNTAVATTWEVFYSPDGNSYGQERWYGDEVTREYRNTWETRNDIFCSIPSSSPCYAVYGAKLSENWRLAWPDNTVWPNGAEWTDQSGAVWVADILPGNRLEK